ncbi:MAG: hypothetical protein WDM77_15020 [Steroidobacteraceae bacterium]
MVWATHHRVLKSAGYGPLLFLRDCRSQYAFYLQWPPARRTPAAACQSTLVATWHLSATLG